VNPTEERELNTDDGNTDKDILVLQKTNCSDKKKEQPLKKDGGILGVLKWFPVHGTK
jgi:hypothetical protein